MKRQLYFLVAAIAITTGSAQAQTVAKQPEKRWGFGVLAGANLSIPHITRPYPEHFGVQPGWLIGADVSHRFTNQASVRVQPSLTQSFRGESINGYYPGSPFFAFTTLKVPVLYRYSFLPVRNSLFVEMGAAYNRLISSSYQERPGSVCPIAGPCYDLPLGPELTPIARSAVSVMASLGVNITVRKFTIPISMRYERYVSSHAFPKNYSAPGSYDQNSRTTVSFQNISLITGVNF